MTDVRDSAPSAAAAAPSHPAHPRWLKERTLAMEVRHAQQTGGATRDAELANQRALERLEGKKRDAGGRRRILSPRAIEREERRRDRQLSRREQLGVTYKPVAPVVKPAQFRCGRCGQCVVCRRELRAIAIMAKAREGDLEMQWLTHNLVALHFAIGKRIDCKISPSRSQPGREIAFSRMMLGGERNLAFLGAVAEICDWSVRAMGAWR